MLDLRELALVLRARDAHRLLERHHLSLRRLRPRLGHGLRVGGLLDRGGRGLRHAIGLQEAAELLELTQWKPEAAFEEAAGTEAGRDAVAGECADVLIYLLLISERLGIDLCDAVARKIEINEARYPVSKSRGNARKYS